MPDVKGLFQASAVHSAFPFSNYLLSLFVEFFLTLAKKFFLSLNCPSNEMNGYLFRSILWPGQDYCLNFTKFRDEERTTFFKFFLNDKSENFKDFVLCFRRNWFKWVHITDRLKVDWKVVSYLPQADLTSVVVEKL